jgi:cytochrome d ubiquinol oxidase subunit II
MEALQIIWFCLIGILIAGYAILDGFDLGVGFWHLFARKKGERSAFIHSIEPFWDGNEVWLLTAGGALFAAFPPVYATVFSGFYLAVMLILLGLIFRAVAIEYRDKVESPAWTKAWDFAFSFGSILPSLLFGVAIGNVLNGLELNATGDYTAGFFALLNPFSLLCGLAGLSMFALHGAYYLAMKLDGRIAADAGRWASRMWYVFLPLLMLAASYGLKHCVHAENKWIPLGLIVLGLAANTAAFVLNRMRSGRGAFLASSCTIAFVMLSVASALFPTIVPCTNMPEWSLTVFNASSSRLTLFSMLVIALIGMPIVLVYTWFIHRVFRGKVQVREE